MIYLIYSLDKEMIEKYLSKLILKESIIDNSVIRYTLNEDNVNDILEECNTMSLFSLKKLVILESTNALSSKGKEITEITKYLDNYNKNVILVFTSLSDKVDTRKKIYKKINEIGKIECLNKDNNYLKKLIKEKINDYKMNDIVIDYFLNKVGSNINNIENELDKLMIYKLDEKEILKEDIDSMCISNMEEEIFALSDAIIKNDNKKALELYNLFITRSYEVTQMIGLIASQFRFLLQIKLLYNKGKSNDEIAKLLEVHPYRVKLAINNCYYYSVESLSSYLNKLFELDKNIKLGLIDKNIFFQLFILNRDI